MEESMFRKIIWPLLLLASISLMVAFIIGFVTSITISNGNRADTTSVIESTNTDSTQGVDAKDNENDNANILVLGDSIGFGVGDDPNQGLGRRYATMLDPEGIHDIKITNLSIPGAKVSGLLELVKQPENAVAISEATLIILSIGGNDLNNIDALDVLSLEIDFKETLKQYTDGLLGIVDNIRALNDRAQLAIVGLYDPYAENDTYKTSLLLQWNYETQRIAATDERMIFIPTYELFQYNLSTYLAADQFHPSNVGYQVIAEELYRILHGVNK
jgi:lysophospholipase L1-like esterase